MKKNLFIFFYCMAMVFGFAAGSLAEKNKVNQSDEKGKITPEVQAAKDLATAGQLAEYGRRVNNPLALLAAAQIMKNTPAKDEKREKTTEGTAKEDKGKKSGELETPEKLLADAKAMAEKQDNQAAVSLIDKESKLAAKRGAVGGAVRHVDSVRAGNPATDVYRITFRGGWEAGVVLIGDGDCDLDLYVYDENGHLIAKDTDGTDRCVASWTPRWTGTFIVKVKNYCSVYADYILASN